MCIDLNANYSLSLCPQMTSSVFINVPLQGKNWQNLIVTPFISTEVLYMKHDLRHSAS